MTRNWLRSVFRTKTKTRLPAWGRRPTRLNGTRTRIVIPEARRSPNGRDTVTNRATDRTTEGPYALATGEGAVYRLGILHGLYGAGTRGVLLEAGLRRGMRVADLGCGVGMVTAMISDMVGAEGHVVGVDFSGAQLTQARDRLKSHARNTTFLEASAVETGLPVGTFDMVYCRFLLLHMPDPEQALQEMWNLLKPNGILVCEDGELSTCGSVPHTALGAAADLFTRLGSARGLNYDLGRRLYHMVADAGFVLPQITFNQPVVARGENKRLLELSVAEAGPAFVDAGLITAQELDDTLAEMRRLASDETVLAVMPRMAQVWARKPAVPRI